MWFYEKRLEYPIHITQPNAKMASFIISQYGGPDGEAGAAMRYLSQRYATENRKVSGLLTDIGVSVPELHIGNYTVIHASMIPAFYENCLGSE
jgi:Mn-containing catalase